MSPIDLGSRSSKAQPLSYLKDNFPFYFAPAFFSFHLFLALQFCPSLMPALVPVRHLWEPTEFHKPAENTPCPPCFLELVFCQTNASNSLTRKTQQMPGLVQGRCKYTAAGLVQREEAVGSVPTGDSELLDISIIQFYGFF